ncbi:GPI ethanolamine phosphate transferase 2-like [Syngnathus typhle]
MEVRSSVFASWILIFQVLGAVLFLRGFFPEHVNSSPFKSNLTDLPAEPLPGGCLNSSYIPKPLFKKVIIMLIDAMRADFVFGASGQLNMPYTTHLMERGSTLSFVAKARTPTVTAPRLKALTTGNIPVYIDVLMNLNSPAVLDDNLIWQANTAGKKIFFYGDCTWLHLFPNQFVEYDGIAGPVSDFREVDNNVTRHLDSTLKRDDWDILILHYLGIDHIGHSFGPHSSFLQTKLSEMDDVLKKIHSALDSKEAGKSFPYLLVLCGDHGMSNTGSHGGSSEGEINTPLLLISPVFKRKVAMKKPDEIDQVDLTPTLALSLGLPISQSSVGCVIPGVFEGASLRDQLRYLQLNGHQLSCLFKEKFPDYRKDTKLEEYHLAEKAHGRWMKLYLERNTSEALAYMGKKVMKQYLEALSTMSSALRIQLNKDDLYSMIFGLVLVLQPLLALILAIPEAMSGSVAVDLVTSALFSLPFYLLCLLLASTHVLICTSADVSCYFCSVSWSFVFGIIVFISASTCFLLSLMTRKLPLGPKLNSTSLLKQISSRNWSKLDILLLAGTASHILSLGSVSFIEEEHQIWYFLLTTLYFIVFQDVCAKYFRKENGPVEEDKYELPYEEHPKEEIYSEKWLALATPLFLLVCCRLLRSLNQTGVQWAHLPDLAKWLNRAEHKVVLSLLSTFCLVLIYFLVQRRCSLVSKVALALGLLSIYCYRAAAGSLLFPWQHCGLNKSKGILEARFVYVLVLSILFMGTKNMIQSQINIANAKSKNRGLWEIYSGLVLLFSLLFRAHNLLVLCCCLLIQTLMAQFIWKKLHYDAVQITIIHYWLGQAFYYFQGNSNSISTIDISIWSIGFHTYAEVPAIILTALNTYAGPLLWACHLVCFLSSEKNKSPVAVGHGCYFWALLRSMTAAAYIVVATGMRHHPWTWSVFYPKLLYEAMHLLLITGASLIFNVV